MEQPAGAAPTVERWQMRVTGTVQGVGFRPFVYRAAGELGLSGFVLNDSAGVLLEAEGPPAALGELRRRLAEDAPPLARVVGVVTTGVPAQDERGFAILESRTGVTPDAAVSVDSATCADCLVEVDDPTDRRYRYPFTNCTNCGPRYTIVIGVPYDRAATTMAAFSMCPDCQAEYDDPADRRFHAQPNACPACGPRLQWFDPSGRPGAIGDHALQSAVDLLRRGGIVAVKGIGGYHLAVDATDAAAVAELRRRKARDDKPFALLVPDLAAARSVVYLDEAAEATLRAPARPIVIAPRLPTAELAPGVAPGLADLGVMLAYSALHHLLAAAFDRPLVLTSGNLADDPIAHTDPDAVTRLGPMVDGILGHDRPIHVRCDDSVVRSAGRIQVLRRSRGMAPEPMALPFRAGRPVLAVGAELKSTVAVVKGSSVIASHHIGDLEHLATYRSFLQAMEHLPRLYGVQPQVVAHDLHPEYLSTKAAQESDLPTVGVQHHHAHIAACLVDNGREGPVVALAFDGLGYGPDGTFWGGEVMIAGFDGYERVGHLRSVPMPGGAAAIREPWRMAVAWADRAAGRDVARSVGSRFDARADALCRILDAPGTPTTTSVGRLFDAVAALVLGRDHVTYEGQAAIELETLARTVPPGVSAGYQVDVCGDEDGIVIDPTPLLGQLLTDDRPPAEVAAAFHDGFSRAAVDAAMLAVHRAGLGTVALTGGVFQNRRLTDVVEAGLRAEGIEVLVHRRVPANDGGISIGQAAIACRA
ncbi:MAG: carbamoyltransferase HypF [Acidimicrobiales bacterium]